MQQDVWEERLDEATALLARWKKEAADDDRKAIFNCENEDHFYTTHYKELLEYNPANETNATLMHTAWAAVGQEWGGPCPENAVNFDQYAARGREMAIVEKRKRERAEQE